MEMLLTDTADFLPARDVRLVSRLLEGQFPNYRQVLPQAQPVSIVVPRAALAAAVERAAVLSRTGPAVVVVGRAGQTLDLERPGDRRGQLRGAAGHRPGRRGRRQFVSGPLHAGCAAGVRRRRAAHHFAEGDVPASFKPVDGDDYLCLIMPVRLQLSHTAASDALSALLLHDFRNYGHVDLSPPGRSTCCSAAMRKARRTCWRACFS